MKRKILLTTPSCLLILLILYPGLQLLRPANSETDIFPNAVDDKYVDSLDFSQASPAPLHTAKISSSNIKQTGWIPDWAFDAGYQSFTTNYQYFDSISPVWYYLASNGQVTRNQVGYDQIRPFTQSHNIKLIPTITGFSEDDLSIILNDPQKLQSHADYLISEMKNYNYDGIDIDYESIYLSDTVPFHQFLSLLHDYTSQNNKTLSVSVLPAWTAKTIRPLLRQTTKVQNWADLADVVDELRIMTYNLTDATSTYPGPIAPLDWMEAVLRYATTQIDMSKVILGINLYGYDGWAGETVPSPYLGFNSNPLSSNTPAIAYNYDQISEHQPADVSKQTDTTLGEPQSTYFAEGQTQTQFYADANFAAIRADLARKYGVKGVAYWRLGNEDPNTYSAAAN